MSATRRFRRSIVLAALSLFSLPAHSIAQTYTVTDLGTLSGNLVSKAYALNNAGVAAGTSSDPTAAIAVMFSGGHATSISTLQSSVSVATAINGSGQIVGWSQFQSKFRSPGISVQHRKHAEHQLAFTVPFRDSGLGN
jgi:hypothetical protein